MASMRKMRMNIPAFFYSRIFSDIFLTAIAENQIKEGVIELLAYRNRDDGFQQKHLFIFILKLDRKTEVLKFQRKI